MNTIKVFSVGDKMHNYGGAQKVMLDIHNGIKDEFDARVLGLIDYKFLNKSYNIYENDYVRLINPFILRKSILLIHSRRMITFYYLLNKILFLKANLIYVAHNTYTKLNLFTYFSENIISISDRVTDNLVDYFNISKNHITKIHNGIPQIEIDILPQDSDHTIRILYAARINDVKQQVDIVKNLKGRINSNIKIVFAGVGPDVELLKQEISDSNTFEFIGFVENIQHQIYYYDYLMLYSKNEGLPISLMEGIMMGKPLIINDVGGNLEIGLPNVNSFVANNWCDLIDVINNLPHRKDPIYNIMSENSINIFNKYFKYDIMIHKYKVLINKVYNGK